MQKKNSKNNEKHFDTRKQNEFDHRSCPASSTLMADHFHCKSSINYVQAVNYNDAVKR